MKIQNITINELNTALAKLNQKYDNNITWNRSPELYQGWHTYRCTIRVKYNKGKGAKLGFSGRRTIAACWHAHGDFFDCVLEVAPKAAILVSIAQIELIKIYKDEYGNVINNWRDVQVGSLAAPMLYSEMCQCDDWR